MKEEIKEAVKAEMKKIAERKKQAAAVRLRNKRHINIFLKKTGCQSKTCKERRIPLLDFHHVDPSTKFAEVRKMANEKYGLAKIQEEIEKCVVLCAICHRVFHHEERIFGISPSIDWDESDD